FAALWTKDFPCRLCSLDSAKSRAKMDPRPISIPCLLPFPSTVQHTNVSKKEEGKATMNTATSLQNQLLATKLFMPVASGILIARPRLSALLNESLKYPLTLVSAPA